MRFFYHETPKFTREICLNLLELYKQELGGFGVNRYLRHPELLYSEVQNPHSWVAFPVFYDRIGSRFSEDTKLGFKITQHGDLEVLLYLHPGSGRITPEEQAIEDRFLARVKEFVR